MRGDRLMWIGSIRGFLSIESCLRNGTVSISVSTTCQRPSPSLYISTSTIGSPCDIAEGNNPNHGITRKTESTRPLTSALINCSAVLQCLEHVSQSACLHRFPLRFTCAPCFWNATPSHRPSMHHPGKKMGGDSTTRRVENFLPSSKETVPL